MKNIKKLRKVISMDFLNFHSTITSNIKEPMPLKFDEDPTLFFTNCSICLFKRDYIKQEKISPYLTVQECLRTNNFKEISLNSQKNYKWNTSIYMLGGFVPVKNNDFKNTLLKVINKQTEFYLKWIKDNAELKINLHNFFSDISQIEDLLISNKQVSYEFYNKSNNDLEWKYGLDNIRGFGIEWTISKDETNFVFGNVILMFQDEKIIGIDFGGSLEILIQHILDLPYKIFASYYVNPYIYRVMSNSIDHIKVVDIVATLIDIIIETNYCTYQNIRIKYIFNQYTNLLKDYIKYNDFKKEFITKIVEGILDQKNSKVIDRIKILDIFANIYKDIGGKNEENITYWL